LGWHPRLQVNIYREHDEHLCWLGPYHLNSHALRQTFYTNTQSSCIKLKAIALFVWLISRTFSANEQYFSLTTNQPTVLLAMAYQPSEQGNFPLLIISIIYQYSVNLPLPWLLLDTEYSLETNW